MELLSISLSLLTIDVIVGQEYPGSVRQIGVEGASKEKDVYGFLHGGGGSNH